jgi:hypothetical protein
MKMHRASGIHGLAFFAALVATGCGAGDTKVAGYGSSINADVTAAVQEAYGQLKSSLGDTEPKLVLMVTSGLLRQAQPGDKASADADALAAALNNTLPARTKLWGLTAGNATGMFDTDGSKMNALGLLGLSYPDMVVGIGSATYADDEEAGRDAVLAALADAGKTAQDKPNVVLLAGPAGKYQHNVIRGIGAVLGSDVPVVGGNATGIRSGEFIWYQFTRNAATQDQVLVATLYGDFRVGTHYGYYHDEVPEHRGVATKADYASGKLDTIDNQLAAIVYQDWLSGSGHDYADVLACVGDLTCSTFPRDPDNGIWLSANTWAYYSMKRPVTDDPTGPFTMAAPIKIMPDLTTITCCDGIEQNKPLTLMRINAAKAASAAADFSEMAQLGANIAAKDVQAAFAVYCDSPFVMDPQLGAKVTAPFKARFANSLLVGGGFSGEVGYTSAAGSRFLAFSASVLLFAK